MTTLDRLEIARATRRRVLRASVAWLLIAGGKPGAATGTEPVDSAVDANGEIQSAWKMGLIADLHYGLAPDALRRLEVFMESVSQVSPDCIFQLGDFNYGVDDDECMKVWNQFAGPKFHVLGNHDMDKRTKDQMVDRWQMIGHYYSFDHKGWHFVVLDRNHLKTDQGRYIDYANANFYVDGSMRGYADPEQLEWLADDLEKTDLPTVVFSHQGLGMNPDATADSAAGSIEAVLENANEPGKPPKVRACFCGHHHIDRHREHAGVHYVWINSASYYWVGGDYGRMAPYTEPLFTHLTFHSDHSIEVAACQSDWADPSPRERGFPRWKELNTAIVGRRL